MISSPVLSELVRTLKGVPDPAGALAESVRELRRVESDLRLALEELQTAPSLMERGICIARRNHAMQELIAALQHVAQVLQHESR